MQHMFVSFSAQGKRWLLRLSDVQEIIPMVALEPVEGGDARFRGVFNLRGSIIAVFGAGGVEPLRAEQFILVLRNKEKRAGLIVDEVHDVISVSPSQVATPEVGLDAQATVVRLDQTLIPVWKSDDAHRSA